MHYQITNFEPRKITMKEGPKPSSTIHPYTENPVHFATHKPKEWRGRAKTLSLRKTDAAISLTDQRPCTNTNH